MIVWNGDRIAQWGGTEYGGTFTGTPPLSDVIHEAATIDGYRPPGGLPFMQRITCRPKDGPYGSSTGYRVLTRQWKDGAPFDAHLHPTGYDSWLVGAFLLPPSFPGGANVWVAPFEWHQTDPGNGTGVAPGHVRFTGRGLAVDVSGGPKEAGGPGNPGRVVSLDASYPIDRRDVWHVMAIRYRYGRKGGPGGGGAFDLRHGIAGATPLATLASLTDIDAGYSGLLNYVTFGVYREKAGTLDTILYAAGLREYDTEAEAVAWARTLLGAAPVPPPSPDAAQAAIDAIRASNPKIAKAIQATLDYAKATA